MRRYRVKVFFELLSKEVSSTMICLQTTEERWEILGARLGHDIFPNFLCVAKKNQ